jgi:hypothetical protein
MSQLKIWDATANGGDGDWVVAVIGAQGLPGTVAVQSPLYITGSSNPTNAVIGIDQTQLSIQQTNVTNLTTDLAARVTKSVYAGTNYASTKWVETTPRTNISTSQSLTKQFITYNFFTPVYDLTVTGLTVATGATPASGAGYNYLSFSLYNFSDNYNGTLLAQSDTAINTAYLSKGVSSITRTASSTTATVTAVAHGYSTGNSVILYGTGISEFDNKTFTVTVVNTNTFTITTALSTEILASANVNGMSGILASVGLGAANSLYYKPFGTISSPTSIQLTAGTRYGIGILVNGATFTTPSLLGTTVLDSNNYSPPLAFYKTGQSSPASFALGDSGVNPNSTLIWGRLS